jgi:hypothetical protein
MHYNSQRTNLRIREYGRHLQDMANHILHIEDRALRTKAAFSLVKIMGQVNPLVANMEGGNEKLWEQLHRITDFKLDVEAPYPKPNPDKYELKPDRVAYSTNQRLQYRHYGLIIPLYIKHAKSMDEGEEKQALTQSIANMMKKAYLNWNRDTVEDEVILEQLNKLGEGVLKLDKNFELDRKNDLIVKNSGLAPQVAKKKQKKNKNFRFKKKL